MRRRVAVTVGAALLALTACAPEDGGAREADGVAPGPSSSRVDVDTAELRALKAEIGIEQCPTGGSGRSALPDVTLPCLGGGPDVRMSSLTGPMVVNFWYAGCAPCKEEMPALQAFYEEHGDRVPVLGVDYQDVYPAEALAWARDTGALYPQVADPGGDLNAADPFPIMRGAPYLGFVDEDGDVAYSKFGGVDSADELVALVREHLGVDL